MGNLRLICALATWRTLRRQEKTQNDVIAIFCKNIIKQKYETTFFDTEHLQQELQNVYGFSNIPNSVIADILYKKLREFLQKDDKGYRLVKKIEGNDEANNLIENYRKEYNEFANNLQNFVKQKSQSKTAQEILDLFNNYLLLGEDETLDKTKDQKFFAYFADFLLNNKDRYSSLLQTIKEGLILYEGFKYKVYEAKIPNKLVLFLDTEIIFSAMGYNGELYKKKFDEFYNLAHKYDGCKDDENMLRMPLYYDEMVEVEIRNNFDYARKIKKQGFLPDSTTAVLRYLTNNFTDYDEINTEESRFFSYLNKKLKIIKYNKFNENYDDLLIKYKDFNIETFEILEQLKQEYGNRLKVSYRTQQYIDDKAIQDSVRALNLISLIRHSSPNNFFDAQVMLITNTALTRDIAKHQEVKDIIGDKISLAHTLDFVTARLWEFLSSSLVDGLETINPIFNIQVLLKEMLNNNLMTQYTKAIKDYNKNNDSEFLKQEIIDIKKKADLEPTKENIDFFEAILSNEILEEEKKLQYLENDKQHKLGIEKGKEIGRKEGIELGIKQERERVAKEQEHIAKETRRKEKKDKLDKLKRNICNKIWRKTKKIWQPIKGHAKANPIKFIFETICIISACLTIYIFMRDMIL